MAAVRTNIAGFFILNPFFSPVFAPVRHSPENDLFADSHGKVVNQPTGKIIARVAADVTFFLGAVPDLTLLTVHEAFVRQAAAALDIRYG